jgi:hypothetical protein
VECRYKENPIPYECHPDYDILTITAEQKSEHQINHDNGLCAVPTSMPATAKTESGNTIVRMPITLPQRPHK